jgi:hypothetical protein
LNGGLEIWTVEGRIRRGIQKQCKQVFLLSWSVSRDGRFYLSWLVIVIFDFCCANNYIMTRNVFMIGMVFIRGGCWGLMTKREEICIIDKRACRRSTCIWIRYYRYLLIFSLIHVVGQVSKWTLETSVGVSFGWAKWEKWKQKWEVNRDIYVV